MMRAPITHRRKMPVRVKLREADIERTCCDLLKLDDWRILKTDPVSDRSRGKGFGEKGMADTLAIRYRDCGVTGKLPPAPAVLWIEWKSLTGRLGQHQKAWHEAERARGGDTIIAGIDFPETIEGFWSWYRNSGYMRKQIELTRGAA